MRVRFGNLLVRLRYGGILLSSIEQSILVTVVESLPPELGAVIEEQLEQFNVVQREIDGRALNFYRMKSGRVVREELPVLPIKPGETKLLSLSFAIAGMPNTLHATATAVDGIFFCLSFSADLRPFADCRGITVKHVTASWRSNLLS